MNGASRVVAVLCEGYHDRSFWAGLLEHRGWKNPGTPGRGGRIQVPDPYQPTRFISGGIYRFDAPSSDVALLVIPCRGDANVLKELKERLRQRETRPLGHLIVNLDADVDISNDVDIKASSVDQAVERIVHVIDPSAARTPEGHWTLSGGTRVSVALWHADATDTAGVPQQQTLERLVCAALCTAHPGRGDRVHQWLQACRSGESAGTAGVKEHAWSHMAGWYADSGCDDFYRSVWRDPAVARELAALLTRSGVWRTVEQLER